MLECPRCGKAIHPELIASDPKAGLMNDSDIDSFDEYWRTVSRNEEFIRQYGHNACMDWEDKWHQDLEDAYSRIQPLLSPVTQRRMFHQLPGELNPFDADNYHHALAKFLNPPERWFGNVGVLCSPEYLALKQAVAEEVKAIYQTPTADVSPETTDSRLDGFNDTAIAILQAMDDQNPRTLKEIATKAGYGYDNVRRYSKRLQNANLIEMIESRGFIRLIDLDSL